MSIFSAKSFAFLRGLKRHNDRAWFEAHREDYERDLKAPMRALVEEMDDRFARFAPEILGDPKRSPFRIFRDVRFSKDKSPYKTHASCWFYHRDADRSVGQEAHGGGAGFYFHIEPGACYAAGGLWMPPRPMLNRLRDAIAEDPKGFAKVGKGMIDEHMLKKMPRGFAENHPAAKWLRYTSFAHGRDLADAQALSPKLPQVLERQYTRMLPLVRWLNTHLGLRTATRR